ncbi:hypothetical protein DHODJN_16235 [Methylorubrum extorquens]
MNGSTNAKGQDWMQDGPSLRSFPRPAMPLCERAISYDSIMPRMREAKASITKGFVSTCMPGSR